MSRGTTLRNIRISDELWAAAGKVAKATDQDISSMIRGLLVEHIGEFEAKAHEKLMADFWAAGAMMRERARAFNEGELVN